MRAPTASPPQARRGNDRCPHCMLTPSAPCLRVVQACPCPGTECWVLRAAAASSPGSEAGRPLLAAPAHPPGDEAPLVVREGRLPVSAARLARAPSRRQLVPGAHRAPAAEPDPGDWLGGLLVRASRSGAGAAPAGEPEPPGEGPAPAGAVSRYGCLRCSYAIAINALLGGSHDCAFLNSQACMSGMPGRQGGGGR